MVVIYIFQRKYPFIDFKSKKSTDEVSILGTNLVEASTLGCKVVLSLRRISLGAALIKIREF